MPVIKLYPHGITAGIPPRFNTHKRAKRTAVAGWSYSSIRNNTRFLYSITEKGLSGDGYAVTLTLKDCPVSHDDWRDLLRAYFMRLRRLGMIRGHWVTEWQRRGVPHLHAAIYLPAGTPSAGLIHHWLEVSRDYRTGIKSQHMTRIKDAIGWFQYVSKHASRGLGHYQRSPENVPSGWVKTGRMWGKLGTWPIMEAVKLDIDNSAFHKLRRVIRGSRIADSRAQIHEEENNVTRLARSRAGTNHKGAGVRRLISARSMLKCTEKNLSTVRGISEWMEYKDQYLIIEYLSRMGYEIEHSE